MDESVSLQTTRRSLNTAGMRVTNQRSLIMEIIRQGEGHLDRLSGYIKRNVAEVKDFEITETEVRVSGYCAECGQGRK